MIINGRGHWNWLWSNIVTKYKDIFENYNFAFSPSGFLLCRKLFHNNAECIIIKRTSHKVYKIALFRGDTTDFTSRRTADEVCEYLNEQLLINPFKRSLGR